MDVNYWREIFEEIKSISETGQHSTKRHMNVLLCLHVACRECLKRVESHEFYGVFSTSSLEFTLKRIARVLDYVESLYLEARDSANIMELETNGMIKTLKA